MTPRIETRSVAELQPAAYNPRTISDEAMRGLEASIDRWGLVQPIVWNERTGRIVGGHQRLKALASRGIDDVSVVVVDLDEFEEKALNVTLNNPHIAGEFTHDLQPIIAELDALDDDLFAALRFDELAVPAFEPRPDDTARLDEASEGGWDSKYKIVTCPQCDHEFKIRR